LVNGNGKKPWKHVRWPAGALMRSRGQELTWCANFVNVTSVSRKMSVIIINLTSLPKAINYTACYRLALVNFSLSLWLGLVRGIREQEFSLIADLIKLLNLSFLIMRIGQYSVYNPEF
jgi:hypothetical protein